MVKILNRDKFIKSLIEELENISEMNIEGMWRQSMRSWKRTLELGHM